MNNKINKAIDFLNEIHSQTAKMRTKKVKSKEEAYAYITIKEGIQNEDWSLAAEGVFKSIDEHEYYFIEIFDFKDRKKYYFKITD
jgi:hypothetical protein